MELGVAIKTEDYKIIEVVHFVAVMLICPVMDI